MGKIYYRTEAMENGGPFRCHNCGKLLIRRAGGSQYKIVMECARCKALITVEMKEPVMFDNSKEDKKEDKVEVHQQ